jgi:hypothetical protein
MGAGFKIEVEGRAAGSLEGLFECEDFGVLDAVVGVGACTDFVACRVYDHRAYRWIRRYKGKAGFCQLECSAHVLFVS